MNTPTSKLREDWKLAYATVVCENDKDIADYWLAIIEAERTAVRNDLEMELAKLIIKTPVCYCKTHPEHNCGTTSNDAVFDALAIIHKTLDV